MFAMDVLYPLVPNDGLLQIVIKNAVWEKNVTLQSTKMIARTMINVCDGCVISPGSKWWFAAYSHQKCCVNTNMSKMELSFSLLWF